MKTWSQKLFVLPPKTQNNQRLLSCHFQLVFLLINLVWSRCFRLLVPNSSQPPKIACKFPVVLYFEDIITQIGKTSIQVTCSFLPGKSGRIRMENDHNCLVYSFDRFSMMRIVFILFFCNYNKITSFCLSIHCQNHQN